MPRILRPLVTLVPAAILGLLAFPTPASAGQQEPELTLRVRVERGDGGPVPSTEVVLHRVSAEDAGELSRGQTDADGRFDVRIPYLPDPDVLDEVFFASVRYRDILYFGSAISEAEQLDSTYVIRVFDTVSAPSAGATFPVQVRNLVLEQAAQGWRVTDLVEIRNDRDRTVVPRPGGVTWQLPLPSGALQPQLAEGDLVPAAVTFADGRMRVTAPIPPGSRLFVVRYGLPRPEVDWVLTGTTERIEVLIREPAPEVLLDGLARVNSVELEPGSAYRHFTADERGEGTLSLRLLDPPAAFRLEWVAVALAVGLTGLGIWGTARRERSVPSGALPGPEGERRRLALQVARLDDGFAAITNPSDEERARYENERERLLEALVEASGAAVEGP